MIAVDWTALGLGIASGALVSAVFFAGLAFGMHRALQVRNTIGILALSAGLRMIMFLGIGWVVVVQAGPWAFVGYGLAFLIWRRLATTMARITMRPRGVE